MGTGKFPRLIDGEYDARGEYEMKLKGWTRIKVQSDTKINFTLFFYDPVRLMQEQDAALKRGDPCFMERNLIIVPEVSTASIMKAITFLWEEDRFDNLKPDAPRDSIS